MSAELADELSALLRDAHEVGEIGSDEWDAVAAFVQRNGHALVLALHDTALLDWLQAQGTPGLPWVARESTTGRGYRLHQTVSGAGWRAARAAIRAAQGAREPSPW